ncbi:ATP-grasp domain protein [Planctomycetes bacterium Pan216]|uniref:ATP-grasp domain protein n=1 Tax=Kolteria novifilia TaxID=2527975 RepID=A0A518B0Y2_9BACT|nr:ATP-grasp domain protein [Planctomycetes bacterium Pan216]
MDIKPTSRIVIVGASARGIAMSARRCGLEPIAFDLFADWDTSQIADTRCLPRDALAKTLRRETRSLAGLPLICGGGLENAPDLIEELSENLTLWGSCAASVREVRDPFSLTGAMAQAGIAMPGISIHPATMPTDGSWLQKPLRGTGGMGITPWRGRSLPEGTYGQQRIEGEPHAALFLLSATQTQLLGVTRQLLVEHRSEESSFRYGGSIGPVPLREASRQTLQRAGNVLGSEFGLRGIVGLDFVLDAEEVWPIEVNPRWTASVEVLERSLAFSGVALLERLFGNSELLDPPSRTTNPVIHGKRILFAPWRSRMRASAPCYHSAPDVDSPRWADIPPPGTIHDEGSPVLTHFVHGLDADECQERLREQESHLIAKWLEPA